MGTIIMFIGFCMVSVGLVALAVKMGIESSNKK
jgi:uncharacterized membrane protein